MVYEDGKPKAQRLPEIQDPYSPGAKRLCIYGRGAYHAGFPMEYRKAKDLQEEGKDISYGSFTRFPDLIMMDGGRGQVNIALAVLEQLGLSIPVCGMVKDDNHRTRGLYYQ